MRVLLLCSQSLNQPENLCSLLVGEKGFWEVSSHAVNDVTSRGKEEGNMPREFHFSFPGRSKDDEIS